MRIQSSIRLLLLGLYKNSFRRALIMTDHDALHKQGFVASVFSAGVRRFALACDACAALATVDARAHNDVGRSARDAPPPPARCPPRPTLPPPHTRTLPTARLAPSAWCVLSPSLFISPSSSFSSSLLAYRSVGLAWVASTVRSARLGQIRPSMLSCR